MTFFLLLFSHLYPRGRNIWILKKPNFFLLFLQPMDIDWSFSNTIRLVGLTAVSSGRWCMLRTKPRRSSRDRSARPLGINPRWEYQQRKKHTCTPGDRDRCYLLLSKYRIVVHQRMSNSFDGREYFSRWNNVNFSRLFDAFTSEQRSRTGRFCAERLVLFPKRV